MPCPTRAITPATSWPNGCQSLALSDAAVRSVPQMPQASMRISTEPAGVVSGRSTSSNRTCQGAFNLPLRVFMSRLEGEVDFLSRVRRTLRLGQQQVGPVAHERIVLIALP